MQKFWQAFFWLVLGVVVLFFVWGLYARADFGKTKLLFFPIHDGDAIYIKTPHGKEIIIDGGIDGNILSFLPQYRFFWDKTIDFLVITHPDADHYYGAIEVLKRYTITNVLLTGALKNDPKYAELFTLAKQKNANIIFANDQTDFHIDGVLLDVLFPQEILYGSELMATNNESLVIKVSYAEHSLLLTGDIESETEFSMLQAGIDLRADVLKVPHHGSRSSSSSSFIDAVSPQIAVITAGTENRFGHPHMDIVERYMQKGILVKNTKTDGVVELEWGKP